MRSQVMRSPVVSRVAISSIVAFICLFGTRDRVSLGQTACSGSCPGSQNNSCAQAVPNPCAALVGYCSGPWQCQGLYYPLAQFSIQGIPQPWYICNTGGNGLVTCGWTLTQCATIIQY